MYLVSKLIYLHFLILRDAGNTSILSRENDNELIYSMFQNYLNPPKDPQN